MGTTTGSNQSNLITGDQSAEFAARQLLVDFEAYCRAHPSERFWQALRNWSGHNFILASDAKDHALVGADAADTFYWKGRGSRAANTDGGVTSGDAQNNEEAVVPK